MYCGRLPEDGRISHKIKIFYALFSVHSISISIVNIGLMLNIVDALIQMHIRQLFDQVDQKLLQSMGGRLVNRVDTSIYQVDRRTSKRSTKGSSFVYS